MVLQFEPTCTAFTWADLQCVFDAPTTPIYPERHSPHVCATEEHADRLYCAQGVATEQLTVTDLTATLLMNCNAPLKFFSSKNVRKSDAAVAASDVTVTFVFNDSVTRTVVYASDIIDFRINKKLTIISSIGSGKYKAIGSISLNPLYEVIVHADGHKILMVA